MLAGALTGCATFQLDIMPRGPGEMAHGEAKQIDKTVTIQLGSSTFYGHYVLVRGGSFSLANAFGGGQTATATAMGISAVGSGNVLAHASDGHNLRCVFDYSGWSRAGTGTCLTDDGQIYDMQITR